MRVQGDGQSSVRGFLGDSNKGDDREDVPPNATNVQIPRSFAGDHYPSAGFASESAPRSAIEEYERHHPRHHDNFSWFVIKLTVTSALGGFIFGYDTGVVSGAMLLIREDFLLSDNQVEVVVSITIAGAVVASLAGGSAMEWCGRRPVILTAAIIFTVGAVLLSAAQSYLTLVAGRLIVGLGIGLASLTTPVYIAEAAPSHMRGTLVTLNTLFITVGQVVAGVVDGLFSDGQNGWRYMLGVSGVPSLFMTLGFLFLPESPRWLVAVGQRREALCVLQTIRGTLEVHAELEEMIDSATDHASLGGGLKESATVRGLLEDPRIRRALVLGCGLQMLQQLSGINTVMYYSATIARWVPHTITDRIALQTA